MAYTGVYVGPDSTKLAAFESWLGQQVDSISAHSGKKDWADWQGSIDSMIRGFDHLGRDVTFTIPMFASTGNLATAASGAYDNYYLQAAKKLAAGFGHQDVIYVRIGEEFNGDWFGWAAEGREEQYIDAYRTMVDAFRSVSSKFKFDWNINVANDGMNPADAYPGDAYVDVIGADFYYDTRWDPADPAKAWDAKVNAKYGLQWVEDFAKAHGKETAYAEWGVNADFAGAYLEKVAKWFEDHDVAYANYWNTNSAFDGLLSNEQNPATSLAYKIAFGDFVSEDFLGDTIHEVLDAAKLFAEVATGGIDTVKAAVSYQLGTHLENLQLTGLSGISGTGNDAANVLTGNSANNALDGQSGTDTLYGGAGDDTLTGGADADHVHGGLGDDVYYLGPGDVVFEAAGEGTDVVYSNNTVTLGDNVENLVLTGTGKAAGLGNELGNKMVGNAYNNSLRGFDGNDTLEGGAGADTLEGGVGRDVLVGGAGNDVFAYSSTSHSRTTPDRIVDLTAGDKIDFSKLDASTKLAGNQAFTKVAALTGKAGQAAVSYDSSHGFTTVMLDINGDKVADTVIEITGNHTGFSGWMW